MIWVPIASVLIFFALLIPSSILGYKKGWRSALFVSLVLVLFTLFFTLIGLAIYQKALWPLYSNTFLKSKVNNLPGFDVDVLSDYYKTRVLLIFAGLMMPLSYLGTFLTYKLLKEKINKYLGPKTIDISKSEKQLVYRRNTFVPRATGVGIMTVSSLFASSFVASAMNSLTTPYKNANFLNKMNDALGSIYSFGLATNEITPQVITNFLSDLDNEIIDQISEVINFSTDGQDNVVPDIAKIDTLIDKLNIFETLFNYEAATAAIFKSVVNHLQHVIDPLALDTFTLTSIKDANENTIGYNRTPSLSINDFKNFIQNENQNVQFIFEIPYSARQILYDKLLDLTLKFEDTIFNNNVLNMEMNISNTRTEIQNRKDDLINSKQKLIDFKNERQELVANLEKISGYRSISTNNGNATIINFNEQQIDENNTTGTIKSEIVKRDNLNQVQQNKDNIRQAKETTYNSYNTNEYARALNERNIAKNDFDNVSSQLASFRSQLSAAKSEKNRLENDIRNWPSTRSRLNSEIASLNSAIQNNNSQKNTLSAKVQTILGEISNLNSQLNTLQNQKNQAESNLNTKNNEINTQQGLLNGLSKTSANYQAEFNRISSIINSLRNQASSIQNQINGFNSNINNLNNQISNKTRERDQLNSSISNLTAKISSDTNSMNQKQQEIRSGDNTDSNNKNQLATLTNTTIPRLETQIRNFENELATKQSVLNTKEAAFNIANQENNRLRNEWQAALKEYQVALDAYNAQSRVVSRIESDYTNGLQRLLELNNFVIEKVNHIEELEKNDVSFNQIPQDVWAFQDDKSIHYQEQILVYYQLKLGQLNIIREDKRVIYYRNIAELEEYWRIWLHLS